MHRRRCRSVHASRIYIASAGFDHKAAYSTKSDWVSGECCSCADMLSVEDGHWKWGEKKDERRGVLTSRQIATGVEQRPGSSAQMLSVPLMCTQISLYALNWTVPWRTSRRDVQERLEMEAKELKRKFRLCWLLYRPSPSGAASKRCMRSTISMTANDSVSNGDHPSWKSVKWPERKHKRW